jgi:hypothetical protein
MKFKHKGGEIDVDKKLLSGYTEEQLAEFGEDNGIDPEDVVKLKERVGATDEEDTSKTKAAVKPTKKHDK